ncbi:MAG TPA: hypothetical protein ENO05_03645, partial [Bacteroides sp.]|nr:hypothetical protein [Bacteroides sp.]
MLNAAFAYSLNVFSQDYIPMNFEKGRWSVELDDKDGWDEKIQVYCKGDTLIEDLLYSKLYQNRLEIFHAHIGLSLRGMQFATVED